MATNSIKLLTGNSHPQLAKQVAGRLVEVECFLCFSSLGCSIEIAPLAWEGENGGM
jgi:hypothetical protein